MKYKVKCHSKNDNTETGEDDDDDDDDDDDGLVHQSFTIIVQ